MKREKDPFTPPTADIEAAVSHHRLVSERGYPWTLLHYRVSAFGESEWRWEMLHVTPVQYAYSHKSYLITHRAARAILRLEGSPKPDFRSADGAVYDFGLYDACKFNCIPYWRL